MNVPYNKIPDYNAAYIPTPHEIELACRAIQSGWNGKERERRTTDAYRAHNVVFKPSRVVIVRRGFEIGG